LHSPETSGTGTLHIATLTWRCNARSGLTPGSRDDVRGALKAIDEVLHFVEHHFCDAPPTFYDVLEPLGGVDNLVDVIERV
jgi:hypothetical protein